MIVIFLFNSILYCVQHMLGSLDVRNLVIHRVENGHAINMATQHIYRGCKHDARLPERWANGYSPFSFAVSFSYGWSKRLNQTYARTVYAHLLCMFYLYSLNVRWHVMRTWCAGNFHNVGYNKHILPQCVSHKISTIIIIMTAVSQCNANLKQNISAWVRKQLVGEMLRDICH